MEELEVLILIGSLFFYHERGGARSLNEGRQISLHWYTFVVIGNS